MTHAVLVQNKAMAQNVDAFNRAALAGADLDNGWIVRLPTRNTAATRGLEEVWDTGQPAATTGLQNLWMVYEPEVANVIAGSKSFRGIDPDPRDFYTVSGELCSVFKPQVGDIITLTGDALGTGTGAASAFAVATASTYKLTWASAAVSGLSLAYLETTYISLGTGAIDSQRVVAYRFEVVAIA